MDFNQLKESIKLDYSNYKLIEKKSFKKALFMSPGFKLIFFMRLCKYTRTSKPKFLFLPLFVIIRYIYKHYQYKFCIDIPYETQIGSKFYIGHFGGVVINNKAILGDNIRISQGVTIGNVGSGVPVLGNNISIGAGAKIIGGINIGNNCIIGAGAIVTKNVPNNCTVVGNPAYIIKKDGRKKSEKL